MLIQFERVTVVPDIMVRSVCYVTRDGANGGAVLHFVSADGNSIHSTPSIGGGSSSGTVVASVDNIAARDRLTLHVDGIVRVLNAEDDVTVDEGGAMYYYDKSTDTYDKISEDESVEGNAWSGTVDW